MRIHLLVIFCLLTALAVTQGSVAGHDGSSTAEISKLAKNYLAQDGQVDPRYMVDIGGTLYFIGHEITLFWFDAIEFCNALSMRLTSFESLDENMLVRSHLRGTGNGSIEFWTSGHRVQGGWLWTGVGEIVQQFDWGVGQPDYSGGDVTVHVTGDMGWADDSWAMQRNFICE